MASSETVSLERRDAARRWLSRYCFVVNINDKMLSLIESAEQSMTNITQQYKESVTSSAKEAMSGHVARLEEACISMKEMSEMYGECLDEITEAIEKVGYDNPQAGIVLAKRYLVWGRPTEIEEIADTMGYSVANVEKLHYQGLDAVARCMDNYGR